MHEGALHRMTGRCLPVATVMSSCHQELVSTGLDVAQ